MLQIAGLSPLGSTPLRPRQAGKPAPCPGRNLKRTIGGVQVHNAARDLACPELWADSLARSRARRQQGATRVDLIPGRKGLAVAGAVAATAVPVATAAAAGGGLLQRGDEGGRV